MVNQKRGAQRQFSWKFLLLTVALVSSISLFLLFLLFKNVFLIWISTLIGASSFPSMLNAAWQVFKENLPAWLKKLMSAILPRICTTLGVEEPPQGARE